MEETVGLRGRSCGACGSRLIGWGHYWRQLRLGPERGLVRVPRLRCRRCGRTCGALPDGVLHRRLDGIDTVGRIIAAGIRGTTVREIAVATRVPSRTVRDIAARYREHAPELAHSLLALSVALGHDIPLAVEIPLEPERRAAFGLGAAWLAARRRGAHEATPWRWLAAITGGRVLATNTRLPDTGRHDRAELSDGPTPGFDAGPPADRRSSASVRASAAFDVRVRSEFRRDPSPSTAAEPSPRNPAGSSPNSAAGNTCCRRFPPLGKIE